MAGNEDPSSFKPANQQCFYTLHDGVVHDPLGAASYVFQRELAKPLLRNVGVIPASARFPPQDSKADTDESLHLSETDSAVSLTADTTSSKVTIHIGAQPNNSPHTGTIVVFTEAFLLARLLQTAYPKLRAQAIAAGSPASEWVDDIRVVVQLDIVDTAPDNARTEVIDGFVYQHSHRSTGAMETFLPDYYALLKELSEYVNGEIKYTVEYQDTLMRLPGMRNALRAIIVDGERIAGELAPEREALAIRSACPVVGCSIADKHGIKNVYNVTSDKTKITFTCPTHGAYTLCLENADDRARIELNTPLRNLARTLTYFADTHSSRTPRQPAPARVHMRVTGADYAGFYQEHLLHRQLTYLKRTAEPELREAMDQQHPVLFYAPLITDWSGAKLSKSLYVKQDAYKYLDKGGMTYLLEYRRMVEDGKDRRVIFDMVEEWVQNPKKLFRPYSIDYIHSRFMKEAVGRRRGAGSRECQGFFVDYE